MNHKKWQPGTLMAQAYRDIANEHNTLFVAWEAERDRAKDLLAENNRLDRELDEARQALKSPIRVPFSEAQIERMAKAACESWHGLPSYAGYHDAGKQEWRDSIRAALAAGGFVPCAALRQPIDADAWKTHLALENCNGKGPYICFMKTLPHLSVTIGNHGIGIAPSDAARAAQWLASYAAAHGCPVGPPVPPQGEPTGWTIEPSTDNLLSIGRMRQNAGICNFELAKKIAAMFRPVFECKEKVEPAQKCDSCGAPRHSRKPCAYCNPTTPKPLENIGIDWKPAPGMESEAVNG